MTLYAVIIQEKPNAEVWFFFKRHGPFCLKENSHLRVGFSKQKGVKVLTIVEEELQTKEQNFADFAILWSITEFNSIQ